MNYETIKVEVHGALACLTLNRPEKLNAFTIKMHEEVRHALDWVAENSSVRALVLTGAGRAFCAGQDLKDREVQPGGAAPDLGVSIEKYYAPLVRRLKSMPKPVVCGVNGVAAGAGANIPLACDIVIAVQQATFIQPFSRLGLVPDAGGTWFLPRLVGRARALGLAMMGDTLSAEQAYDWGLIWRCVSAADFDAEVMAAGLRLAAGPTLGLVRTKQAIDAAAEHTFEEQLALERDFQSELGLSHDYAEGVLAFTEKRVPQFVGR